MSRQYISSFRPKPSMMPRMTNTNRVSCMGRPRTPSFLKDYKKSSEPKSSRNKSEMKGVEYIDSPAAKLAVRRNVMQVQMLESALTALRAKEKKALRDLENEMRRYRKDLETIPVRSLTSNIGTNLDKLLPPIENEDVVLKRFGKIKSTIKMKLKKKPWKQQNKTALVQETELRIEESEVKEPVIINNSQRTTPCQTVTFSRPASAIQSPPLRIVTTRMSSSKSYSSSRHKHNVEMEKNVVKTERTQDSILRSSSRQTRASTTSAFERNSLTKDQQHQADLPERVIIPTCQSFSNELSKPSSEHKPAVAKSPEPSLSENIAKTCGEYLGLLKLISQQQMTSELANKSTSPLSGERAASHQSSVALVPVSGSNKTLSHRKASRTIRLRDNATQFEDKYVVEETPSSSSTPKEMWPSWFSPNSKPVQTDSTYSPDESLKKRTTDTGMNTSYIRKDTQQENDYEMYANTKLKSHYNDEKLPHHGVVQLKQKDNHYKPQYCARCSSFPEASFMSTLSSYDSALSGFNNSTPSGRRNNQIFITSTDESVEETCSCYYRNSHRPKSRYMEKNRNCSDRIHSDQRKKHVSYPIRGHLKGSTSADKALCSSCSKTDYVDTRKHIHDAQSRSIEPNDALRLSSVSSSNSRDRSRNSNHSTSAQSTGCHICQQSAIMSTQTPAEWKKEVVQMHQREPSPPKCINRSAQVSFLRQSIAETQTDREEMAKHDIGVGTTPSLQLLKKKARSLSPKTTSAESTLLKFANETPVDRQQESPRFNNPITSELEKHSMVGVTQTEESFDVDNHIRVPSVWRPIYHIPNCKPKSARLVPILQPDSNNPVFHVELCTISEEKSTSHSVTPQKSNCTSSTKADQPSFQKFTFTRPFEIEEMSELSQADGSNTKVYKKETSPEIQHKPFRPMSRIESDLMADNVFHRETNLANKYVTQSRRKYVPAQFIEPQPTEVQDIQQPMVNNEISPVCAMIRGEECSDFVDCTSLRSADFATRWRRGFIHQYKRTPSSPVRSVWKKASPDDASSRRQFHNREFSGSSKKISQACKRHLSSPKINRSDDYEANFYDADESNLQNKTSSGKNIKDLAISKSYPPVKLTDNSTSMREEPKSEGLQKHSIRYKVSRRKAAGEKENENQVIQDAVEKNFQKKNSQKNFDPENVACNSVISSLGDFNIGSDTQNTDLKKLKVPKLKPEPLWKHSTEADDGPTSFQNLIKLQKYSSPSEPITDGNTVLTSRRKLSPTVYNSLAKQKDVEKALEIEKSAQTNLQERVNGFLNDETNGKKVEENFSSSKDVSENEEDVEDSQAVPCEIYEISNKDIMAPRARKRLMIRK